MENVLYTLNDHEHRIQSVFHQHVTEPVVVFHPVGSLSLSDVAFVGVSCCLFMVCPVFGMAVGFFRVR